VLFVLGAVAIEDSALLYFGPVDSEGFGSLDAKAVYGDTKIAVEVGACSIRWRRASHRPLPVA
jgi:hypothetical protein